MNAPQRAADARLTFTAEVTDIRLESRSGQTTRWRIALDHTLFTPAASKGLLLAVAPRGARLEVPVLAVLVEDGFVWHVVDKPLTAGTEVTGTLTEALA